MDSDYGLKSICETHEVVIVDNNVVQLRKFSMIDAEKREKIRSVLGDFEVINRKEMLAYAELMLKLFRKRGNFVITEKLAEEYANSSRVRASACDDKTNRYSRTLKRTFSFASRNKVLKLRGDEAQYMSELGEYLNGDRNGVSETDFDMLLHCITMAAYRGPAAILSNDVEMTQTFRQMASRINTGQYSRRGLRRVANRMAMYSLIGHRRFELSALSNPQVIG